MAAEIAWASIWRASARALASATIYLALVGQKVVHRFCNVTNHVSISVRLSLLLLGLDIGDLESTLFLLNLVTVLAVNVLVSNGVHQIGAYGNEMSGDLQLPRLVPVKREL